jgi:hypothetical protein
MLISVHPLIKICVPHTRRISWSPLRRIRMVPRDWRTGLCSLQGTEREWRITGIRWVMMLIRSTFLRVRYVPLDFCLPHSLHVHILLSALSALFPFLRTVLIVGLQSRWTDDQSSMESYHHRHLRTLHIRNPPSLPNSLPRRTIQKQSHNPPIPPLPLSFPTPIPTLRPLPARLLHASLPPLQPAPNRRIHPRRLLLHHPYGKNLAGI